MLAALIPALAGLIGKAVDKAVPDKDLAEKLKLEVTTQAFQMDKAELDAATSVILAEAKGESWLQRNWRPLTALTFVALVVAHWLGFTPPNLPEAQVLKLMDVIHVMIGGYALTRSGEKIVQTWAGTQRK